MCRWNRPPNFRNESMFIRCVCACVSFWNERHQKNKHYKTFWFWVLQTVSTSWWVAGATSQRHWELVLQMSREGHAGACCYGLVAHKHLAYIDGRIHASDPNVNNIHGIHGAGAPCGLDYLSKWSSSISTAHKGSLPPASFATKTFLAILKMCDNTRGSLITSDSGAKMLV